MGGEVRTAPGSAIFPGSGGARVAPSVPAAAPQSTPCSIGMPGPHRRTAPAAAPYRTCARPYAHASPPRRARAMCAPVLKPRTSTACTREVHTGPQAAGAYLVHLAVCTPALTQHEYTACTCNVSTSSHSAPTHRVHVRCAHQSSARTHTRHEHGSSYSAYTQHAHTGVNTRPHTVHTLSIIYTWDVVSHTGCTHILTQCEHSAHTPCVHTCPPSTHMFSHGSQKFTHTRHPHT